MLYPSKSSLDREEMLKLFPKLCDFNVMQSCTLQGVLNALDKVTQYRFNFDVLQNRTPYIRCCHIITHGNFFYV